MSDNKGITDFGERVGGANKEAYQRDDLGDSPAAASAKKSVLWPTPDYQAVFDDDVPRGVVWFMKKVHDACPTRPASIEWVDDYVEVVTELRDDVMACEYEWDTAELSDWLEDHGCLTKVDRQRSLTDRGRGVGVTWRLVRALDNGSRFRSLADEADEREFLFTDRERALHGWEFLEYDEATMTVERNDHGRLWIVSGSGRVPIGEDVARDLRAGQWLGCQFDGWHRPKAGPEVLGDTREEAEGRVIAEWEKDREATAGWKSYHKGRLAPPHLDEIRRVGPPTPRPEAVTGQDLMDAFGVRGGEFGNWLPQRERQLSLDMTWDALHDFALAWGIEDRDVSFGGRLAIAFGSRGRGPYLAHYECEARIINMTRLKGAGSLAHELMHAADDILGSDCGCGGLDRSEGEARGPLADLYHALQRAPLGDDEAHDAVMRKMAEDRDWFGTELRAMLCNFLHECDDADGLIAALTDETFDPASTCPEPAEGEPVRTAAWKALDARVLAYEREEYGSRTRKSALGKAYGRGIVSRAQAQAARDRRALADPLSSPTGWKASRYAQDARALDRSYTRLGNGYWSSRCELLARAGAVITYDRLAAMGIRDDYLCGHATGQTVPGHIDFEDVMASTVPEGAERQRIAEAMQACVDRLIERGLLHRRHA